MNRTWSLCTEYNLKTIPTAAWSETVKVGDKKENFIQNFCIGTKRHYLRTINTATGFPEPAWCIFSPLALALFSEFVACKERYLIRRYFETAGTSRCCVKVHSNSNYLIVKICLWKLYLSKWVSSILDMCRSVSLIGKHRREILQTGRVHPFLNSCHKYLLENDLEIFSCLAIPLIYCFPWTAEKKNCSDHRKHTFESKITTFIPWVLLELIILRWQWLINICAKYW